jgi:DNA-binding PadR family transcriptional regulator
MKDDLSLFCLSLRQPRISSLALAGEDRHGDGIMQEVARRSEGTCRLGPGTLYDNLQRLVERGLIQEVPGKSADENSRRRY